MKKTQVTFVELTVQTDVLPLVSGYLHANAITDPELAESHQFNYYCEALSSPRDEILRALLALETDVYAISCYVWNMGVIKYLVRELRTQRPGASIILGGPQVINHAEKYLDPQDEKVCICNGEGELTFAKFLLALKRNSDLAEVPGLSFYRDGELRTTQAPELIERLDDIPSPFLQDLFPEKAYAMTIFETNRGCPYQCTFCYWGRGDDLSVRKFSEERLHQELDWIAKRGITMVFLADANWGLLARDVDLSRRLVAAKQQYGFPAIVNFSAAKAKPHRSAEIAKMFSDARIITSQAIGIQSMSEVVLSHVKRKNIRLPVLEDVRRSLESSGISTFTELIWPLPGETTTSFASNLDKLCESGVTTVVVYPALLLHSTPMEGMAADLGLRTTSTRNDIDEIELIVETKDCSYADYEQGMWGIFGLYVTYNMHTLRRVAAYLFEHHGVRYSQTFFDFGRFCSARAGNEVVDHWRTVIDENRQSEFAVLGGLAFRVLHGNRRDCRALIDEFVRGQSYWEDERLRALYELDVLGTPYMYANTPFDHAGNEPWYPFEHISFDADPKARSVKLRVPTSLRGIKSNRPDAIVPASATNARISYKRRQMPLTARASYEQRASYCHGMLQRSSAIVPSWDWGEEARLASEGLENTAHAAAD